MNKNKSNKYALTDLSKKLDVEEHIIQFWLEEFSEIGFSPDMEDNLFSEEVVKKGLLIKRFLYQEGFTLKGAKRRLKFHESNGIKSASTRDDLEKSAAKGVVKNQNTVVAAKNESAQISRIISEQLDRINQKEIL
ncbi:MAG: MerR family transcriptional regulator [Myxococcota bacterium]